VRNVVPGSTEHLDRALVGAFQKIPSSVVSLTLQ